MCVSSMNDEGFRRCGYGTNIIKPKKNFSATKLKIIINFLFLSIIN